MGWKCGFSDLMKNPDWGCLGTGRQGEIFRHEGS